MLSIILGKLGLGGGIIPFYNIFSAQIQNGACKKLDGQSHLRSKADSRRLDPPGIPLTRPLTSKLHFSCLKLTSFPAPWRLSIWILEK